MTCQSNSSHGRGHDRIPKVTFAKWRIVRRTSSLTNHSEVMLPMLTNHRSGNAVTSPWHQWRPSCERNFFHFVGDFSVVDKCWPCAQQQCRVKWRHSYLWPECDLYVVG